MKNDDDFLDALGTLSLERYEHVLPTVLSVCRSTPDPLKRVEVIRGSCPEDARPLYLAALRLAVAWENGASKYPGYPFLWTTRESTEQASSLAAAHWHASLFHPDDHILEIGAGTGIDTIALSRRVKHVIAIERDPVLSFMLTRNLAATGCTNVDVVTATAEEALTSLDPDCFDGIWADPSRRNRGMRVRRMSAYSPPLEFLTALAPHVKIAVKTSPVHDPGVNSLWGRTFVATRTECTEQILHRGFPPSMPVVMHVDRSLAWTERDSKETPRPLATDWSAGYLVEPHPALIRAHAVASYFDSIRARFLDRQIAYGHCLEQPPVSAWHQSFHILEAFVFRERQLKERAAALEFGPGTEIKKRGFPVEPEDLRASLPLEGNRRGVIILTRMGATHHVFLCERTRRS